MRFTFTSTELAYLNGNFQAIKRALNGKDVETGLARTVSKMKYKFTPNALYVNLTAKEQALMNEMLSWRQSDLAASSSISEEVTFIQTILEKLEGPRE